jgi:hypothetical protein
MTMREQWLVLPRLDIRHANALTCPYFLTPAVPMACRQFARALARDLGLEGMETGVAIIHHHSEMLGEWLNHRFQPHQRRGSSLINRDDYAGNTPATLALQPVATMHIKISLAIRFDINQIPDDNLIRRAVGQRRLAGGIIQNHSKIQWVSSIPDILEIIKTGHIVVERRDLLTPNPGQNRAQAWCQALFHEKGKDQPWLAPALLGFGLLSKPQYRIGAREGYPFAFAEPLAGIIEYLPRRKLDQASLPVWDYVIEDDFIAVSSINHQS